MWDSELGLVYYNWRYYNVAVGRWDRRDPEKLLTLKDNDYGYLKNSQYSIDVLGLHPETQVYTPCCMVKTLNAYMKSIKQEKLYWKDITNIETDAPVSFAEAKKQNHKNPRRQAKIKIVAAFSEIESRCCVVKQYVSVNGKEYREDIDEKKTTYGPRNIRTKTSKVEALRKDGYYYYYKSITGIDVLDNERGNYYESIDEPKTSTTNIKEKWKFKIVVVDACRKDKEVKTITYTIRWK